MNSNSICHPDKLTQNQFATPDGAQSSSPSRARAPRARFCHPWSPGILAALAVLVLQGPS